MLHRAILGSFERFLGILIEKMPPFPLWLAPVQVVVTTITMPTTMRGGGGRLAEGAGVAVSLDLRNEKINRRSSTISTSASRCWLWSGGVRRRKAPSSRAACRAATRRRCRSRGGGALKAGDAA